MVYSIDKSQRLSPASHLSSRMPPHNPRRSSLGAVPLVPAMDPLDPISSSSSAGRPIIGRGARLSIAVPQLAATTPAAAPPPLAREPRRGGRGAVAGAASDQTDQTDHRLVAPSLARRRGRIGFSRGRPCVPALVPSWPRRTARPPPPLGDVLAAAGRVPPAGGPEH